jgi:hypothetical protein
MILLRSVLCVPFHEISFPPIKELQGYAMNLFLAGEIGLVWQWEHACMVHSLSVLYMPFYEISFLSTKELQGLARDLFLAGEIASLGQYGIG